MTDFLSLHDADQIAEEAAPVAKPGLAHVFAGVLRTPGDTLSGAFAHPIQSYAMAYAAAGGVYWALNLAITQAVGEAMPLSPLLGTILLVGLAGGIGYLFALSILISWSCDILGGQATRKKIRTMLAYAGTPGLVALVAFGLPKVLLFGRSLFMPERTWISSPLVWVLWFGDALCFVWSGWLVIRSLKIMNGFSTGRAVLAAILPLGPVALIGLLFLSIAWSGVFFAPPAF